MKKPMLKIENLTKYYGKIKGVEDLSLEVEKGEIFGFIGPNGSGKSTTIRTIMNLINKTSGNIYINGEEFKKNNIRIKENIGYLPSEINLYDDLTVKELIDYNSSFYKKINKKRRKELVSILELDEKKNVEDLSLGNLKKLGIVLALMHEPQFLILDEPSSGLDPIMQEKFYKLLLDEKKKGTTIFYSTHILSEVSKICDRVGIIKNGHLIKIDKIEELKKNNLSYVTITSKDSTKILESLEIKEYCKENTSINFVFKGSFNELIKVLNKYDISKIKIEEPKIEDMFMHYYKEED